MRETDRLRERPGEGEAGARPGETGRSEPAAGGGPGWSRPAGEHPTWAPEQPGSARRGFWLALVVVLGIAGLFWLLMHLYALWLGERREVPPPTSPPASTAPRSGVGPPGAGVSAA